jgi:hypothetical protein
MREAIVSFVVRRWPRAAGAAALDIQAIAGGLEASVARVRFGPATASPDLPVALVAKRVTGTAREALVYQHLWRHWRLPPAVRLLGLRTTRDGTYLFLEDAAPACSWPWTDVAAAAAVCRELARLHDRRLHRDLTLDWDYEAELSASAEATVHLAERAVDAGGRRLWRRRGDLRRVVRRLGALRARLLAGETTLIHGDMHPGNVCTRDHARQPVVFVDWARARPGSPLEDIASWLHSLGCWEPQARRRHDTLMRAYLDARRGRSTFDRGLRMEYWLASASNGLAGAIRYHLAVSADPASDDDSRSRSRRALNASERVVKRAAALLRTSPGR